MMEEQKDKVSEQKNRTGQFIRELRKRMCVSQAELAKHMDVTRSAVCQWEKGATLPKPEYLRKLAAFFEVSVDDLLCGQKSGKTTVSMETVKPLGNLKISEIPQKYILRGETVLTELLAKPIKTD